MYILLYLSFLLFLLLLMSNYYKIATDKFWAAVSVTRLGDLLDFVELFKAFGYN